MMFMLHRPSKEGFAPHAKFASYCPLHRMTSRDLCAAKLAAFKIILGISLISLGIRGAVSPAMKEFRLTLFGETATCIVRSHNQHRAAIEPFSCPTLRFHDLSWSGGESFLSGGNTQFT